ncbi:MAG: 5'/3'-nucleotidase SurE, partial [Nitrospirota bacterium]|nr:5'/3'-nucleotidase SurE [Nitrospirota bacterium]
MHILVSNDDGYLSRGIQLLAEVAGQFGDVTVVAPDRQQSAASHALSLHRPLRAWQEKPRVWAVDGTPTDCVNLALNGLLDSSVDLVVSGINHGANLGDDVTYSGTVAAAMEGCLLGVPALAFS